MTIPPRFCREALIDELLCRPASADFSSDPLRPVLASMLAGRALGEGIMPATLGLAADDFEALWQAYFPGPHLRLRPALHCFQQTVHATVKRPLPVTPVE